MTTQNYEINQSIPNFTFATTSDPASSISKYTGKNIILYFYPKDNTPVCSVEAKAFRDHIQAFNQLNTIILGVSKDSVSSHEKFKNRLCLPFDLISDTSGELCEYFDVIKLKNFFGKQIKGIVRSTFVIDKNGILRKAFPKIKVAGHIDSLITALKEIEG